MSFKKLFRNRYGQLPGTRSKKGIQVDANKTKAIIEAKPSISKKKLQRLLGKVNFLERFISNTAGKTKVCSFLLKLKENDKFDWRKEHQEAF